MAAMALAVKNRLDAVAIYTMYKDRKLYNAFKQWQLWYYIVMAEMALAVKNPFIVRYPSRRWSKGRIQPKQAGKTYWLVWSINAV